MYSLDSMYPPMAEAVVEAVRAGKTTRWVANAAWWLGRQDILSARDFWQAVAAMVTNNLTAAEKAEIEAQLSKAEDALLSTVTSFPAVPDAVATTLAGWQPVAETAEDIRSRYLAAIDVLLNAKARERHYDSIATAVSYIDDPNPVFAREAKALFDWRSTVWTYATDQFTALANGGTLPTLEAFLAAVPAFTWPDQAATATAASAGETATPTTNNSTGA